MNFVPCTVIGGGVIGLAIAARLSRQQGRQGQHPSVMILETGSQIAQGISSRNSEVIHSGIYYPASSLKAQLCIEGRERLYQFCHSHKVDFQKTGKLVVASAKHEIDALEKIAGQAKDNGVPIEALTAQQTLNKEPELKVEAALWCSQSGIVDVQGLCLALLGEAESNGANLSLGSRVKSLTLKQDGILLHMDDGYVFKTGTLVNAAGLQAWQLMQSLLQSSDSAWQLPKRYLAKGHYFSYAGKSPFQHLVYPVPEQAGLGIHATVDLGGQCKFGPDVHYVTEENYEFQDTENLHERYSAAIKQYFPALDAKKLQPAWVGIRPKLQAPGEAFADFMIAGPEEHGIANVVCCLGIESPGLTSALAIAEYVAGQLTLQ